MLKITDRKWQDFFIKDIFYVKGTITTKPNELQKYGNVPRITCSGECNGVDNFYKNTFTEKGSVLTIDSATTGAVFYQNVDFIATDHVEKLVLKNRKMNRYVGLFLKIAIDKSKGSKYSYGYKFSQTRIKKQTIMLPVDDNCNPDYDFMEQFIKEREKIKKQKYINYINEKIKILDTATNPQNIVKPYAWRDFFIKDIFKSIQRGKRLVKGKQIDGNVPYVSSSAINNGVDNFISNEKSVRKFSNCLSLANSGSVGSCFYEPFGFIASDHVTHLKNEKYNMNVYLFIATMLKRLSEKYNFNREINDNRISREKIMLPIDESGALDIKYMEYFTIAKLKEKYVSYVEYITF